jgi:hypothetical protein
MSAWPESLDDGFTFLLVYMQIDDREYGHPKQFSADVDLIVRNAKLYSPTGDSVIHRVCCTGHPGFSAS